MFTLKLTSFGSYLTYCYYLPVKPGIQRQLNAFPPSGVHLPLFAQGLIAHGLGVVGGPRSVEDPPPPPPEVLEAKQPLGPMP